MRRLTEGQRNVLRRLAGDTELRLNYVLTDERGGARWVLRDIRQREYDALVDGRSIRSLVNRGHLQKLSTPRGMAYGITDRGRAALAEAEAHHA